jgi:hypothetical protein
MLRHITSAAPRGWIKGRYSVHSQTWIKLSVWIHGGRRPIAIVAKLGNLTKILEAPWQILTWLQA